MKTYLTLTTVAVLLWSTVAVQAQKAPIKYGKVSKKELEMTVYEKDTSAPAVVLCDFGYWNLSDYRFTRTLRIKILKKEGLEFADRLYPAGEDTDIRGKTYNLENGEVVDEKLRNENIFKERVFEDFWRWRVAMPNVKVGSVIDIQFTHMLPPPVWYFQQDIPVIWSEIILPESNYINYKKNFFGNERLHFTSSNH